MERVCSTLASEGFEVRLIGRELKNSVPIMNDNYLKERIRCWFNKGKFFYIEYNIRLFVKLLFTNADIYSAVDLDTIAPCFLAATLKGKKKVFDAHEYFSETPEVVKRVVVKRIWETVASTFIPKADAAYTVSESLAKIFSNKYSVEFVTIRNVPSLAKQENFEMKREFLLYQGALNEGRGLEEIIDAMKYIDMPLKIGGEGDLSVQLREKVKQLGLENKIEFLGFVSPETLEHLTGKAFLGLNLLNSVSPSYYYSLANKFFDYIHHEVPSLNMDFPEYRKINDQFEVSILLNSLESGIIEKKINQLINDKGLYKRLQENCRRARQVYCWDREKSNLLKLYRAL